MVCSPSSVSQFILTSSSHLSANHEPPIWAIQHRACSVWSACTIFVWFFTGKHRRWYLGTPFLLLLQRNRSNLTSSALNQRCFLLLGAFDSPKSWHSQIYPPAIWFPVETECQLCLSICDRRKIVGESERRDRVVCRRPPMVLSIRLVGTQKKAPRCWLSKALSLKQEITGQRDNLYSRRNLRPQAREKCHHVNHWTQNEKE